jgi:hypothetical protein
VNVATVGLFNSIAIATGHEHWLKEHDEVTDFTVPLCAWINQLPAKTIKKLENNLAPAMTLAGLASILAPDIAEEMAIRRENNRRIETEKAAKGRGTNLYAGRPARMDGAISGGARGNGGGNELHDSIPTIPPGNPLNDTFDV